MPCWVRAGRVLAGRVLPVPFCVAVVVERVACGCVWGCFRPSCCPLSPGVRFGVEVVLGGGRRSVAWVGVVVGSCRELALRCRAEWVVVVVGCWAELRWRW